MKPKFQLGVLRTTNLVFQAIQSGYAQHVFDTFIKEYGNSHITKTMYGSVRYAIRFVDLLESLRTAYLKSETRIQVGCFLYLYFWLNKKPMGSSTSILPFFVVNNEGLDEDDIIHINSEYMSLTHFLENPKGFLENACVQASVNLSELKTFVSDVLKLWEEEHSSNKT